MPASRNRRQAAATQSRRLEAFLEMLAAERGAARLTIAAYRNDLADLAGFLMSRGQSLETADAAALHEYLAAAGSRRLAPRTLARRLSAMRQFYRFQLSEAARADDPTAQLDAPRLGRPLPKILAEKEVDQLIAAAAAWPGEEGVRLRCRDGVPGRRHCAIRLSSAARPHGRPCRRTPARSRRGVRSRLCGRRQDRFHSLLAPAVPAVKSFVARGTGAATRDAGLHVSGQRAE